MGGGRRAESNGIALVIKPPLVDGEGLHWRGKRWVEDVGTWEVRLVYQDGNEGMKRTDTMDWRFQNRKRTMVFLLCVV
jgi:hypothetical protein